jgi:MFS family permease
MTMAHATSNGRATNAFGFTFIAPLALGSTLNPINSTMIATALVPIATSLHVTAAQAGWLIAGLYLASSIAQPTLGRFADLFGARRVFLCALAFVAIAGVIGMLATSLTWLVVARVILGIGTSGAYPAAMRIFRTRADAIGAQPPRAALSFLSLSAIGTMAIGPLLGGVLTGAFGWHAIFSVNLPLSILTAILVVLWTPKDAPLSIGIGVALREIDVPGLTLFAATLFALMTFLMRIAQPLWWVLALTLALAAALLRYSWRRENPFFDIRMLSGNTPLVFTYVRVLALATIIYCVLYGFGQWLESAGGFSSTAAGAIMLPMSIAAGYASYISGRTKGIRAPIVASFAIMLVACAAFAAVSWSTSAWLIAAIGVIFGFAQGLYSTTTQAAIYIQAPPNEIGSAAGLQRTFLYLGAIVAASILGFLYGHHATNAGFFHVTVLMGILAAILLIFTICDRTLPRGRV